MPKKKNSKTKRVYANQCRHIVAIARSEDAPDWCGAKQCEIWQADLKRPTPRNAFGVVMSRSQQISQSERVW